MGSKQLGFLLTVVTLVLVFDCGNCNYQQLRFLKSIRSNIATNLEDAESVIHRDSRSIHRRRRSVLNSAEQMQALDDHNRLRRLEGSSSMNLLIWNNELASRAEVSANKCIWNHSNVGYGQNLYSSASADLNPINLTDAIQRWYNEKPYYNNYYITGTCKPAEELCLHYSQVVWGATRRLGCAYARCAELLLTDFKNAWFLVCNYDPPGNVVEMKPYETGPGCSNCTSKSWWCNEGLCDESCTTNPNPSPPSMCGCAPVCLNFGTVVASTCSCSCKPGWTGVDCSVVCENKDSQCDPKPGQSGYPPSYCTRDDYGPRIRVICPAMCGQCTPVGGNSSSALLRNMMLVWLSWLLPYTFRNI